jgi:hypothetical protein
MDPSAQASGSVPRRAAPDGGLLLRHVLLPALAPAALVVLAFTPLTVIGCVQRGLMALGVVIVSAAAALGTARRALRAQAEARVQVQRGEPSSNLASWWLLTTLILLLPLALLVPLG